MEVFHSELDSSINVWIDGFEARFVQRTPEYFIIYISTMKGCDQSCRMCHLTTTGQTDSTLATFNDILAQFYAVIQELGERGTLEDTLSKASTIHINYMARGEPLLNHYLIDNWGPIHKEIREYFEREYKKSLDVRPILSTIFPAELEDKYGFSGIISLLIYLSDEYHPPSIYYSLYSSDEKVRKRWLPKALPCKSALMYLNLYNILTMDDNEVTNKIHFALIKGVNDTLLNATGICDLLSQESLKGLKGIPFNLVRYNPYSSKQGEEADEDDIQKVSEYLNQAGHPTKVIPKVGFDVKASCGMFLTDAEVRHEL